MEGLDEFGAQQLHKAARAAEGAVDARAPSPRQRRATHETRRFLGTRSATAAAPGFEDARAAAGPRRGPSGDAAADPAILVWDVETLVVQHRLGDGWFKAAALLVFFSPDAEALASAGEAAAHWSGVGDADEAGSALAAAERTPAAERRAEVFEPPAIYDGCWLFEDGDHAEADVDEDAARAGTATPSFATVGPGRHVKFWFAEADGAGSWLMRSVAGSWLPEFATTAMHRCVFLREPRLLLTGGGDGRVYAWRGTACFAAFDAGDGPLKGLNLSRDAARRDGDARRADDRAERRRRFPRRGAAGMEDAATARSRQRAAPRRRGRRAASPDGRRVAVGHRDGAIAVHGAAPPRRRVAAFGVARARVTHLDWDATSTCLRVCTSTNELLYYDVDAAAARDDAPKPHDFERRVVPVGARAASDKAWPGATCVFGAHAIGAWPAGRARAAAARANAPAREASAHGSRCAAVRWLSGFAREGDDVVARLATAGGHDRCLLQWKVVRLDVAKTQDAAASARAKKRWSVAASRVKLIGASKVAAVPRKGGSKMALCFMCGALNPAATFANHRRTCASRWAKARDAAKKRNLPDDDDDPGPLPPDPHAGADFSRLDLAALEVANDASQEVYFAHALAECEHCKRRFKKPAPASTGARARPRGPSRRPSRGGPRTGPAPAAWL
ncbi:hypothetical protein JL721_13073 [Aureococcus anophagefferens]|nr:hypothetical protein JL721_13073 [Aureococcus anophagefferens]